MPDEGKRLVDAATDCVREQEAVWPRLVLSWNRLETSKWTRRSLSTRLGTLTALTRLPSPAIWDLRSINIAIPAPSSSPTLHSELRYDPEHTQSHGWHYSFIHHSRMVPHSPNNVAFASSTPIIATDSSHRPRIRNSRLNRCAATVSL